MNIQIIKETRENEAPLYKAFEIKNGVGFFTHHLSNNVSALVEELEQITPKPVITFDNASRVDFWKSL